MYHNILKQITKDFPSAPKIGKYREQDVSEPKDFPKDKSLIKSLIPERPIDLTKYKTN